MAEKCNCGCLWTWLSGFFAMPAVAHIVRLIGGWEITFKGEPFAMKTSWIVVIVCGLLAAICGFVGCKMKKAEGLATGQSCC